MSLIILDCLIALMIVLCLLLCTLTLPFNHEFLHILLDQQKYYVNKSKILLSANINIYSKVKIFDKDKFKLKKNILIYFYVDYDKIGCILVDDC
ncbi:MAG: hypothetical protein DRJ52_00100 [Thermoprotei archaeon]|nr:MAG: hypothetical protein DRJ52_00100 [Thermoprotei archaeon]